MSKMSPKSIFGQQESKERKKEKGEEREEIKRGVGVGGGTTADSLLLLTPTHLLSHWPTQLSSHSGAWPAPANSFLVLLY